jgi:hypothetical protein
MRIPFLFCRYSAQIDDEELTASGLVQALNEIQGQFLPHGAKAEKEGVHTVVVMKPRKLELHEEDVVTWFVGFRPGHRTITDYDAQDQELQFSVVGDTNILHTAIVAIPRLRVMAVNDRSNSLNMGGKPALSRTRSVFKQMHGGHFNFHFLAPGDLKQVVNNLELEEYSYTVRRINPTPPTTLAAALDASMEAEGIFIQRGVAKPAVGGSMKANGRLIAATRDLAADGYGVLGFKGTTPDGHSAQIKKPPFSLDKKDNLEQLEKEQPLRIIIESEEDNDEIIASVVAELVRFYTPSDDAPDTLEGAA